MKAPMRVGAHIEGIHWIAEYLAAPRAMFGEEAEAGAPNEADTREQEAALLASLRRYVAERDAEE